MKIDNNEIEKRAMEAFRAGDRALGLKIQEEFVQAFRQNYQGKDHCSCKKACQYHGNCRECVAIHRAHQDHLPNCFREMVNDKLKAVSRLTEHTMVDALKDE